MSIQPKGNNYYVVITYRDLNEKKKHKWYFVGPSIKEAERREREIMVDLERGDMVISDTMLLGPYLTQWLETCIAPKRRPATVDSYKSIIKTITGGIGNVQLQKIDGIKIQKYLNEQLKRNVAPRHKETVKRRPSNEPKKTVKTVSSTTLRKHYLVLNLALKQAKRWGLIPKNPCESVDPPPLSKAKWVALTVAEAEKLMKIVKGTVLEIPVLLGILCGLRRGEVCGLRWQDVDLEKGSAFIHKSLDRIEKEIAKKLESAANNDYIFYWNGLYTKKSKSILALGPVKTDESVGYIPLSAEVIETLKREKTKQSAKKLELGKGYKQNDLVWCWEDGSPRDPDYLYNTFVKFLETNGLPKIKFHDLRHTHATLLLREKVDTKIVSKKLRHKRASFTADKYQHVANDMLKETADAMDRMFKKTK